MPIVLVGTGVAVALSQHIIACLFKFFFLDWTAIEKLKNIQWRKTGPFSSCNCPWMEGVLRKTKCAHSMFPACNFTQYIGQRNCNFLLIIAHFFRGLEWYCGYLTHEVIKRIFDSFLFLYSFCLGGLEVFYRGTVLKMQMIVVSHVCTSRKSCRCVHRKYVAIKCCNTQLNFASIPFLLSLPCRNLVAVA